MEINDELRSLFKIVRTKLGAPVRPIQLDDDQLCDLLEVCIGDYATTVQNWIIKANWLNMLGQKQSFLQNPQELAFAFSMKSLDFSKTFSYWFSKEVGLQQRGSFELKKDFFKVERGKQTYLIPANREINKVMYVTPSTTKAALYGNLGTLDTGIAGGFGQYGNMGNGMGINGFYIGSAYDTVLLASDLKYKNSLLRGDLAYRITAGPEGTHIVHLMSVPGSPNSMGGMALDDNWGWNRYANCYVWYTYYDTSDMSDEDLDACRKENSDFSIITPDQVPMDKMTYDMLNEPTKNTIRQLLVAEAAITLALIRGTYSGKVLISAAESLQLDYAQFMDLGKTEKERVFTELKERLEAMLPWNVMKNYADMTDNLIKIQQQKPLGFFVR